jgi:hypothetical protein
MNIIVQKIWLDRNTLRSVALYAQYTRDALSFGNDTNYPVRKLAAIAPKRRFQSVNFPEKL